MTTAVLGALCTLASAGIFWNLLRHIWGRPGAYVALLAGLCITFYNGRLDYYNHNTVLMLCVSLTIHCWWKILTTGRTFWWVALGAVAGLGMLSKYQYLLVLGPSLILVWQQQPWRQRQHLRGLSWALLTAALLFMPHLLWLLQQDAADSPIRYALHTARPAFWQGNGAGMSHRLHSGLWLLDLLLNRCLPALLLLLGLKALSEPERANPPLAASPMTGHRFLWLWGALPALTITLLGLLAGMDLQMQWGTAFALWIVPVMMMVLGLHERRICGPLIWLALALFALIQSLLLQSYHTSFYGCCSHTAPQRWRMFDSQALAAELDASAREAAGGRFTILIGPTSAAGAVALALPDRPKVLIDHNLKISPWIHPDELQFSGVVELWPPGTGPDDRTLLGSGWGWRLYSPATDLP